MNKQSLEEEIREALESKGVWMGKIPKDMIRGVSPYNARKHRIEENIDQLEQSIGLTGEIRESLTLNQDFQIVKGQRRAIIAGRWKNISEIPVIIRKYEDKMEELADSYCENQLTYPLSSEDVVDVIYTLYKKWGLEKTSRKTGVSKSKIEQIKLHREAPEVIKKAMEGAPLRAKRIMLSPLRDILKKEGPEAVLEKGKILRELPDHDKDQFRKDYRAGEPIDLHSRLEKAKARADEYELFTIRIQKKTSSGLTKVAKKLKKDKQDLINQVLRQWLEEHKGLLEI